ncbi:protein-tyrosine phosphatase [Hirsutella rhossiliensis]|uniref:Protein-tyrosine phosphatase n=1 Tax=Hirsutella rhossiliensis TaxID=111463 RepID=A0A9P8N442_9HYPO|nr:protein-tyrosine phosphatase [Hirsutella rhossiliensis]KAH0966490.1 protein-tyrosine phosphatase [Hirsutella rhossiliensis]
MITIQPGPLPLVALGGIFWSQVQAYAPRTGDETGPDDYDRQPNPVYDRRWENYGAGNQQPLLSGRERPEGTTSRRLARDFMNELTSPHNTLLDNDRRQTLRQLLDRSPDTEPDRDFPLIRLSQPLQHIDWSTVSIPPRLQLLLAGDLVTAAMCAEAVLQVDKFVKPNRDRRAMQADCEKLLAKIGKAPPCAKLKNLEFGFKLSNDYWSGTYDRIGATLDGPAGKAVLAIKDEPSPGFEASIPVDMQRSFGSDTIDIDGISRIHLTAQGIFWKWRNERNDKWQVQDITLRATCAEPGFEFKNDKLIALNAWYGHPGGWFFEPFEEKTVATFNVTPGDWHMTPPCANIKGLEYEFKLGNELGAGTWDSLSFTLGQGKEISLANSVSGGFSKTNRINLRDVFGSEQVDIRDIKNISLLDRAGRGDGWLFEGISFTASCADVPKKMRLSKFASVDKWL